MTWSKVFFICTIIAFASFLIPLKAKAISPPEKVYINDFFPLYRFIPARFLPLNENLEPSRKIVSQDIVSDSRPKTCKISCDSSSSVDPKECIGDVTLKITLLDGGSSHQTNEISGTCSAKCPKPDPDNPTKKRPSGIGSCTYKQTPRNDAPGTSTDYSKSQALANPKYQNSSYYYNFVPPEESNNLLQYGRSVLTQSLPEQLRRKLTAVAQAQQTHVAVNSEGVWPLGGVDWEAPLNSQAGCSSSANCSLVTVWKALGEDTQYGGDKLHVLSGALMSNWQDMVMPPAEPRDFNNEFNSIDDIFNKVASLPESERPSWYQLLQGAPECGPGYDRGYVFLSICYPKFLFLGGESVCTPISGLEENINGNPRRRSQATYSDPNARATLCSTVYDLYSKSSSFSDAQELIRQANGKNPLLPFTLLTNSLSYPKNIEKHLGASGNDPYKNYFNIYWFAKLIDGWRQTATKMWYIELGYDFTTKEQAIIRQADSYEATGLQNVISFIVNVLGETLDKAFKIVHHEVYVPPASAIIGLDEYTLNQIKLEQTTGDQAAVVDKAKYSNSVESGGQPKFVGNNFIRAFEWVTGYIYDCKMTENYSNPFDKSVSEYSRGARSGCQLGNNQIQNSQNQASSDTGICSVAEKYSVPCCMLAGIWKVETNLSANLPNQSYGSYTCCNSAHACGAMQIMGGLVGPLSNGEKLNPCNESDSFVLAARLLSVKKCIEAKQCDSHEWTPEITKKFPVESSDIRLTGYYYGMNQGCVPDKFSQCRWGAGKSYCDAVQAYMDSCTPANPKNGTTLPDAPLSYTQTYCAQ
ncbi:MAG: hypothetical protein WCL07_03030 [bacterium]